MGSVAEEAVKLLGALSDWAKDATPDLEAPPGHRRGGVHLLPDLPDRAPGARAAARGQGAAGDGGDDRAPGPVRAARRRDARRPRRGRAASSTSTWTTPATGRTSRDVQTDPEEGDR